MMWGKKVHNLFGWGSFYTAFCVVISTMTMERTNECASETMDGWMDGESISNIYLYLNSISMRSFIQWQP